MSGNRQMYFSYSQFTVFDRSVEVPGFLWTETHILQGFARSRSCVSVQTREEFGYASVDIYSCNAMPQLTGNRALVVPFTVESGRVYVTGPDEKLYDRFVDLERGNYNLFIEQFSKVEAKDNCTEEIALYFLPIEEEALKSEILIVDELLFPPKVLLETAEVPLVE